jgi:preprotein translocase subunit SecE
VVTETKPMEAKKNQQVTSTSPTAKEFSFSGWKPQEFVGQIKDEIRKITWTNPEELKVYTQIVVGATFFLGMGIYLLDLLIQSCLAGMAFVMRLIG